MSRFVYKVIDLLIVVPVDCRYVDKAAGLPLLTTYGQQLYLLPVADDNHPCVEPRGATPIADNLSLPSQLPNYTDVFHTQQER